MKKLLKTLLLMPIFLSQLYAQNINKLEYFIDTDPGHGAGVDVPITTPGSSMSQSFSVPLTALSDGIHNLGVRSRDASNNWSMVSQRPFYKQTVSTGGGPLPNITAMEYFLDADPGAGAATAISFALGTNATATFAVPLPNTITDGIHFLSVRAKDANNYWTMVSQRPIYKQTISVGGALPNITAMEYYIDSDPGAGAGTAINFTTGTNATASFAVPLPNTITDGIHFLSVRAKDANNYWTIVSQRPFYKQTIGPGAVLPNITAMEYFIDTDPGAGAGTAISFTNGTNASTTFAVPMTNAISEGIHFLSVRAKDANNNWSLVSQRPFYKQNLPAIPGLPNIVKMEYFFDADPGYGAGVDVPVVAFSNMLPSFLAPVNALSAGVHKLTVRVKDQNNTWSIVNIKDINVGGQYVEIEAAPASWCVNTAFNINFKAVGTFNAGNVFTAQLSNSVGSFASPTTIGSLSSTTSGIISATIPGLGQSTGYRIRVISSNPAGSDYPSQAFSLVGSCSPQIITGKPSPSPDEYTCTAATITVPFYTYGTFNVGNVFSLQMTDEHANNFTTLPANISANTFTASIPITSNTGDSYRLRVVASNPTVTGTEATQSLKILKDIVPPSITAPANINTVTNTGCTATGVSLGSPTTSDNCAINTVTNNAPSAFPLGVTNVVWTVSDKTGNTTTAIQTVTVTDNVLPSITAPAARNVFTNTGCAATGVALGTPVTADNCTVATVTNNAPTVFPLGTTNVVWTVTDAAGNSRTASQVVTVSDNVLPNITAPANISLLRSYPVTGLALGSPSTSDNCTVASVTNNAPSTYPIGVTNVTWTVTDGAGNIRTAVQTVTIILCTSMETVKSGDWNDPAVWTCGRIPEPGDQIIIHAGHSVNLSTGVVTVKKLTNSGQLNLLNGSDVTIVP